MKTKKPNISSINILANGVWIESGKRHDICWEENEKTIKISYDFDFQPSNIPVFRAYSYLFFQLFGKIRLFNNIKNILIKKTDHKFNYRPNPLGIFQNISFVKIIILLVLIYYLSNIELLIINILHTNLDIISADILSSIIEFVSIVILLLFAIRLFVRFETIRKFSRYNRAVKELTPRYFRHNTIFTIVFLLIVFSYTNLLVNLFAVNFFITYILLIPVCFEILNYCERHLSNYFCFIIYSPIYMTDRCFTSQPTKKEQKCATLALK